MATIQGRRLFCLEFPIVQLQLGGGNYSRAVSNQRNTVVKPCFQPHTPCMYVQRRSVSLWWCCWRGPHTDVWRWYHVIGGLSGQAGAAKEARDRSGRKKREGEEVRERDGWKKEGGRKGKRGSHPWRDELQRWAIQFWFAWRIVQLVTEYKRKF